MMSESCLKKNPLRDDSGASEKVICKIERRSARKILHMGSCDVARKIVPVKYERDPCDDPCKIWREKSPIGPRNAACKI